MSDLDLLDLAEAAYTQPPTWQAQDVSAISRGTMVACQGTEPNNIGEWIRDLDALPVFREGLGYVHQGFIDGAEAIFASVLAAKPRILTGHSLGGALALCLAALLVRAGANPALVVTFGAPRVGQGAMRALLAPVVIREYRCGDDPVPLVPTFFSHMSVPVSVGEPALDPIADHFLAAYRAGMLGMAPV